MIIYNVASHHHNKRLYFFGRTASLLLHSYHS